jgi:tetratricopeptide (TPR) repeat protein
VGHCHVTPSPGPGSHDARGLQAGTEVFRRGLVLTRETGHWAVASYLLQDLGFLAQSQNDYQQANTIYEEALALAREHEDRWGSSYNLQSLAFIANKQGDYGRAKALSEQAIILGYELGDRRLVLGLLLIIERVALGQGKLERAARLLSAGEALVEDLGIELDPDDRANIDRAVAIISDQLGEATFEGLKAEGRAMTMEQAIAYALED